MIIRKRKLTPRTEQVLKKKKGLTGLKEEEIIEHAVEIVAEENLLFLSRIRGRHTKNG